MPHSRPKSSIVLGTVAAVAIAAPHQKKEGAPTGSTRAFTLRTGTRHLRLSLRDSAGEALAKKPYLLLLGQQVLEGETDAEGFLEHQVPLGANTASLECEGHCWELALGALLLLGLSIALRAPSQFTRLVAAGMTITLTLYVAINVSMVTGLIPVVGVPLPLISYGGTAMLTTLVAAGLILGSDAHRHQPLARFPADL